VSPIVIDEYAGFRRELEIGICLAPSAASSVAAAKSLAALLDAESVVPVRLAGLGLQGGRVRLTLAVNLGAVDDIKAAGDASRAAIHLLQRIVDDLAAYEPAFTRLPDPASAEAQLADRLMDTPGAVLPMIERLALLG